MANDSGAQITDLLFATAARSPDREAVRDADVSHTYAELTSRASALGVGIRNLGAQPGDRVLLVLPNRTSFVVAHFGVLAAGCVSVPCDVRITPTTIESISRSCSPTLLITDGEGWERLASCTRSLGVRGAIVFRDGDVISPDGIATVRANELIAAAPDGVTRHRGAAGDLAALLYTTGTTGEPKGVMLRNANVMAAVANISSFIGYTADDREVVTLPISHSFGLGHVYCNLRAGGAVYLEPGLAKVGRVFKALREFGATGFPGTPQGYGLLLDRYGDLFADAGKNLRFIVINSAALPPERAHQIRERLPNVDLTVYYGLTEASRSTFISLTREGAGYYSSVGRPMSGVDLRIESESGETLPPGEVGQVTIGGATVSPGYWSNPALTAKAFRDGRLHTGDLGFLDDRGFLFLTGRLSDVINVGGYKVMPAEVEAVVRECAGVVDVAVVGFEAVAGVAAEVVVAAVVSDGSFDAAACDAYCRTKLEPFKTPGRFVLVDSLPKSETGKLLRGELAAMIASRVRGEVA